MKDNLTHLGYPLCLKRFIAIEGLVMTGAGVARVSVREAQRHVVAEY